MGAPYHFVTTWRVPATVAEVKDVLAGGQSLPRWWPPVYLTVDQVQQGGEGGAGNVMALCTKGWPPYTLRWTMRITEPITDVGFAVTANRRPRRRRPVDLRAGRRRSGG